MKNEKPNINFVLKLFRLQNCSRPRPAEAVISMNENVANSIITAVEKNKNKIKFYTLTHQGKQDAI